MRNGKEIVAALTYNGPIESMEVLIATFVVLVWSFTAFKLGFVLHELLEMRKSLLECRPNGYVFSDRSELRTFELIKEVVVLIKQFLLLVSVASY